MCRDKVLAEIQQGAGTQFDPALVDAFIGLDFSEWGQLMLDHQGTESSHDMEDAA